IAFEYQYHIASGQVQYKESYTDTARTQNYARYEYDTGGNLVSTYYYDTGETLTYYSPSENLESKTLDSADGNGRVYYHYMDESEPADAPALYLDGSSYLSVPDSTDWDFGTGSFTVETYLKLTDNTQKTFLAWFDNKDLAVKYETADGGRIEVYCANTQYNFSWSPSNDTWYHIAVSRDGSDLRVFVDGRQIGVTQTSGDNIDPSGALSVGGSSVAGDYTRGYLREFRISGTARYTSDFSTATSQFADDADTRLLLHLDEADGSTSWTDSSSSGHSVTGIGSPVQQVTSGIYPKDTGRLDKEVLGSPDSYSAVAYYYEYYGTTDTKKKEVGYKTADYTTDPSAPVFTTQLIAKEYTTDGSLETTYTYYDDATNLLESKEIADAAGDEYGNVYYHYANEDFYDGYGRIDREVAASADAEGAIAYYYEYHGTTEVKSKAVSYQNADYSDPSAPSFTTIIASREYDTLGDMTDYYAYYTDTDNYLGSRTLYAHATDLYYHYINEGLYGTYGRIDGKVIKTADSDNARAYYYEYWNDSDETLKKQVSYASADYTSNPLSPVYGTILVSREFSTDGSTVNKKYTYYNDETANYLESTTLYDGEDAFGRVYYHYIKEDLGSGYGRVDKEVLGSTDSDGAIAYYYEYYSGEYSTQKSKEIGYASAVYTNASNPSFTDPIVSREFSTNGSLIKEYTYYTSAPRTLESQTVALAGGDAYGRLYYHYMHEAYYDNGTLDFPDDDYGRIDKEVLASADADGVRAWYYEYDGSTEDHTKEVGYSTADYTTDPSNPVMLDDNRIVSRTYTTGGTMTELLYYYDNGTSTYNYLRSKTMYDSATDVYYHYLNDDMGRLDGLVKANADAGNFYAKAYFYEYAHAGGYTTKSKEVGYASADYTSDPKNITYDTMLYSKEYTTDGSTATALYTYYYSTTANYLESASYYDEADQYGRIYYHFLQEDLGSGYGRVDKEVLDTADGDGAIAYYNEYHSGDYSTVKSKTISYKTADYTTDPQDPVFTTALVTKEFSTDGSTLRMYTYYDDPDNYLESNTVYGGDQYGRLYYHYINEGIYGNYGRVDREVLTSADGYGAKAYYYEYDGSTTDHLKEVGYTSADYTTDPSNPVMSDDDRIIMREYTTGGSQTALYHYYNNASEYNYLRSKTLYGVTGDVYYHYLNEDIFTTYGRLDGKVTSDADASNYYAKAYYYEYNHSGGYTTMSKEVGYASADYTTNPQFISSYDTILFTREYTTDGITVDKLYTYYFDENANYLESKTVYDGSDPAGKVYYHYIKEGLYGTYGRVDKEVLETTDGDNCIAYYYEYWNDTDATIKKKIGYGSADYSDPQNATLSDTRIIYEFDQNGLLTKKVDYNEDMTYWYIPNDDTKTFAGQYVHSGYTGGAYSSNTYYTWIVDGGSWYKNTQVDADGTYTEFHYDASYNLTGADRSNADRSTYERLDADLNVIQTTTPDPKFARGVNMPWTNYGYDIGVDTEGTASHMGYSADFNALIDRMRERQGDYMRVFLFNDLRSGMTFDANGVPTGFTEKVYEDMQALLDAAKMLGIKLMPVLLDHTVADNVTDQEGNPVGEHKEIITDASAGGAREEFLSLMSEFVGHYSTNDTIYAWELINEPEECNMKGGVSYSDLQDFVRDFISTVHTADNDTDVTLGSQDRLFLANYWTDSALGVSAENGLDIYQYHYYNRMASEGKGLDYAASNFDKPTIVGEIDPTVGDDNWSVMDKLDAIYENGYAGAMFWEDESVEYTISDSDYSDMKEWIFTIAGVNDELYNDGLVKRRRWQDGDVYEYEPVEYPVTPGFGKLSLIYDSDYTTYSTYDWEIPEAGDVTVGQYSGVYSTAVGTDIRNDVIPGEKTTTFVYLHNGIYTNLDVSNNGWTKVTKTDHLAGETYTYYNDADNYMESKTMNSAPDAYGNWYYHYMNEGYYDNGTAADTSDDYGRMDRYVMNAYDADGAIAYYVEYNGAFTTHSKEIGYTAADYTTDPKNPVMRTEDQIVMREYLADGSMDKLTYFYDNGASYNYLRSKTLYNDPTDVYYHYLNEGLFEGNTYGRLDGKVLKNASAADFYARAYYYEYAHAGGYTTMSKEVGYASADYTSDPRSVTYDTILFSKEYTTDGSTATALYTYYYSTTANYLESKTLYDGADEFGNVYYHYIQEDLGSGYGRVDKKVMGTADADGAIAYYYEYHTGDYSTQISKEIGYASAVYTTDPQAPVFTNPIVSREFSTNGSLIKEYTYYQTVPKTLESQTVTDPAGDAYGRLYYHYMHEAYYDNGTASFDDDDYGRIDKEVLATADADGAKAYAYTYDGSTEDHLTEVGYTTADYTTDASNPVMLDDNRIVS
ncbi:MAG: hypothetical protein GF392_00770, partial [Candidatus Omnitrophica bacterium]|nr:hypothetical protein [Candidatus Omnitrophota bacterium]